MEAKPEELPRWTLMWDFAPSGIAGAFQRGYDVSIRKGSISGINAVLAAYVVLSYCISHKELKHQQAPLKTNGRGGRFTAEHNHLPRSDP